MNIYMNMNTHIYVCIQKSKKECFKTFRQLSSSISSLYYTSKHLLLYLKDIFTIKIVITIML